LVALSATVFLHGRPSLRERTGNAMVGAGVLALVVKR